MSLCWVGYRVHMSSIQKLVREAKPARTLWGHVVTYTIDRVTWMRLGEDPPPNTCLANSGSVQAGWGRR